MTRDDPHLDERPALRLVPAPPRRRTSRRKALWRLVVFLLMTATALVTMRHGTAPTKPLTKQDGPMVAHVLKRR